MKKLAATALVLNCLLWFVTFVFAMVAVWTQDDRWANTALVTGVSVFVTIIVVAPLALEAWD